MDDRLIDTSRLSLSRRSILPGAGFFIPDSVADGEDDDEVEEAVTDAETVVLADPDADGLAAVALIREAVGEAALLPTGPYDLTERLEGLAAHLPPQSRVFICDVCPDSEADIEPLAAVVEQASSVSWYDHHQWDDSVRASVEERGVDLTVGESDVECTADVALRTLPYEFPPRFRELAAVTRDHDLWIREEPRSSDLADFAYWEKPEGYLRVVARSGPDLPAPVQDYLETRRVEKQQLIDLAVSRGRVEQVGPWSVGITYGRCSQNEVAEAFREQGTDAAVIVKPAGSASIRGTDTFEHCHEVAALVDGGGHPKAAGCKPDIYDDMLDYANHWSSRGAVTQQVILEAFRTVAREQQPG
jgi:oligoribonuclease NrnB/cAMP/cGMP phosphodiesterase (DHH superfamily)